MPRSASFRVLPTKLPHKQEDGDQSRLIGGHTRNDVERIISARGGNPGAEEEYLVQWIGTSDSVWVPSKWMQHSLLGRGKVMEYQDIVQQRILDENSRVIQRAFRRHRHNVHEAKCVQAILMAQAMHRGKIARRQVVKMRVRAEARKIGDSAGLLQQVQDRTAEAAAKRRREERETKKAEQMRLVREQAQKLIEQQGGTPIDPNAPLPKLESPRNLGPIARLPSPRSKSPRSGGLKPGKMSYNEYVAALDLNLHRERVKAIRPAVDTVPPPEFKHLKEKLKPKQMELEKNMQITQENNWLTRRVKDMPTLAVGEPPKKAAKADRDDPTQAYNAHVQKLEHQRHRRRVRQIKHAIDADSPKRYRHLSENLKGKQNQEDRRLEMERTNRAMQARLASMQSLSLRKQDSKVPAQGFASSMAAQSAMGSSTGSRSSRAPPKDFQAYLLEMDTKLLRERVKSMQPDVDTEAPPVYKHLQQNLKGKQMFQEKEAEIKRLNDLMHTRVANTKSISKVSKVPTMSRRSGPELTWLQKMERACIHGDEPMLNQALQYVNPSAKLTDGWFPVALCSAAGQLGVLRALLHIAPGDAERKMADGSTPLRLAAARGHANCVDSLLKAHAESDVVLSCRLAAENGHLDAMQCFLNHRADLLLTVPHGALLQLQTKVQKKMPDIAALPQHLRNCFRRVETRCKLLEKFESAAKTGDTGTLRKCLQHSGLSTGVIFHTGWNALGLAAAGGHSEAVMFLLNQGAQVDAPMSDGRSALDIATQSGNIDVATLLIDKKSNVQEERDEDEAGALSSRSARKLKKSFKPRAPSDGTALVPRPPPNRSASARTTRNAGVPPTLGPRKYNWECGEVEGRTMLFGAVNSIAAS